ncbi:hypothetical protein QX249_11730 [Vibrio parahaemolyticus]|uniref:Mobile element protein n=1 Tax=Vibrio parahaemolyticus TaxID=670 RepID=A0AAW8PYM9_VIBPH|nr:hypothetical protein [Vibrio parahaemolyticus]EGR2227287.1 hypothetical protein [Vibrio parahaemolyticus]MDS1821336.1 hypothetical protein [Vibrio parahaemolyticus]
MKHPKEHYKSLPKVNGYKWSFYEKGFHTFQKGNNREGYLSLTLTESDIEANQTFEHMLKNDISRTI